MASESADAAAWDQTLALGVALALFWRSMIRENVYEACHDGYRCIYRLFLAFRRMDDDDDDTGAEIVMAARYLTVHEFEEHQAECDTCSRAWRVTPQMKRDAGMIVAPPTA